MNNWITPDWPAPKHIKAYSTTRLGGVSKAPFDSMNLGTHVEDSLEDVLHNREHLVEMLGLPAEPLWLEQVHGNQIANAGELDYSSSQIIKADASVSHVANKVCIVMTADCLPVLFTNRLGTVVAAAHAGWRGLNNGVLESTVDAMACDVSGVLAWLGPAIGPDAFEVGSEVRDAFIAKQKEASNAFKPSPPSQEPEKWLADIYQLATLRLQRIGVQAIFGGGYCTCRDKQHFFSYRREAKTGRMASLITINN